MNAREKTTCKWLLKQSTPSCQLEEFSIVANETSEEWDDNPSDSNDFNMGSLFYNTM